MICRCCARRLSPSDNAEDSIHSGTRGASDFVLLIVKDGASSAVTADGVLLIDVEGASADVVLLIDMEGASADFVVLIDVGGASDFVLLIDMDDNCSQFVVSVS